MDDFKIVAILDLHLGNRRARNDLDIALDRDAERIEAKLAKQVRDADSAGHPAVLAIHSDRKGVVAIHIV
jgi:hypothetical protein